MLQRQARFNYLAVYELKLLGSLRNQNIICIESRNLHILYVNRPLIPYKRLF